MSQTVSPSRAAPAIAVVGAGIVGATTAYMLSRRGAHVTLIDRAEPGRGIRQHRQGRHRPLEAGKEQRSRVARLCARDGTARAAALRDEIGGGRKVAIHILEFFDRVGYTRRVRDEHALRGGESERQWVL